MKSLLIAALSIVCIFTGFFYGAEYNKNQIVSLKQDLALQKALYNLTKSALDLCIARSDLASYICETGIDPKEKLDDDTLILLSSKVAGEIAFKATCAMCHGATGEGRFGPDIRGADLELLISKVIKGQYPKGYKPKRNTKAMPKFPHLYPKLPDIQEYLKAQKP